MFSPFVRAGVCSLTLVSSTVLWLREPDVSVLERGRRFVTLAVSVDTLVNGEKDSTLARPLLLTVADSLVVFFDYGDGRLRAVDYQGRDRWRSGRAGRGPGEWGNPVSITGMGKNIIVADGGLSRLVRVDREGRVVQSQQLIQPINRVGRLPNGELIAISGARGKPEAQLFDTELKMVRTLLWAGWPDSALGLGGQVRLANSSSGSVALVSMFTGRVMPMRPRRSFDFGAPSIDPRGMPSRIPITGPNGETVASIAPNTKPAIRDATILRDLLFVVPAGEEFDGRVVDVYDAASARYRGSLRIPIEVNVLAADDRHLFAISSDPFPVVAKLHWDTTLFKRELDRVR